MTRDEPKRAGFVAILGAPNAGKSTLLNRLVGAKVSIVSPKVQTTRRRIVGVTMVGATQVMFIDTPGIFVAQRRLERAMVAAAWSAAEDADLVMIVVDAKRGSDRNLEVVLDGVKGSRTAKFLVLNKVDLVAKDRLLPLVSDLNSRFSFEETMMVSALDGDGLDTLMAAAAASIPEGPWLFPEDQLSDLSQRVMAAEITREKIFHKLHQELPYNTTVETESWVQSAKGDEIRIDQIIYVTRDSQKAILLGHGGRMIRSIGAEARLELEDILEVRVHLFLFVKVRKDWLDDPERYAEMGIEFPG